MKAVLLQGTGAADMLSWGDAPAPVPADNQVRIRVHATSVNRPDIVQREGNYPPPKGESEILGLEVAGEIESVGAEVTRWKPGDRVMSLVAGGGYAELALAYEGHPMRIPESMSFEEAACVCESYITAFLNVFRLGQLRDGQTALLHGGGGGVNTAAIQLCKALAPKSPLLVTTAPHKLDRVRALGVDHVIDFQQTPDFSGRVKEITNKRGADVILDHIGASYLAANQRALAYAGTLVIIGVTSGVKAELNLGLFMVKRQRLIGSVLRSRPVEEKAEIVAAFQKHALPAFADRRIVPIVEATFPMSKAAEAHRLMDNDKHFGKIVLQA